MAADENTGMGALLRRHRLAAGLSQEALAERAGLSVATIAALERGRRGVPHPRTIALLAEALQLDAAARSAFLATATGSAVSELDGASPTAAPLATATTAPSLRATPPPSPPTALIGREHAEAAVTHLLEAGETRLLTLTGPGGVGKTRLALAVAATLQASFSDGSIFVDLSALRDPDLVASSVAAVLGVRQAGAESARDLLLSVLRPKCLLLVLDNFEQVVAAAPLVAELVAACPRLVALVTSRTALRLRAEQQFRVPPLETPSRGDLALDAAERYAAVRLFVARARAVNPAFALDAGNVAAVVGVCQRLDGLPLAIELAAAHVGLLPPPSLLARLQHRFTLLAGGAADLPARQQTLRATIEWSYGLLRPEEQLLFRHLAVFAGGCTIAAVERVCDPDRRLDALSVLGTLWDKSLLRREDIRDDAIGEIGRLSLLETIRAYALEQLEASGEGMAMRQAHAAYYLALAEEAAPRLQGSEQAAWLELLEREHPNLRAALAWARDQDQYALGLRLAVALWPFWRVRGYLSEGRAWLEQMLALDPDHGSSAEAGALRAAALVGAAWLAEPQHDYAAAIPLLEESLALCRALGLPDDQIATDLLIHRALQARVQGDYAQAVRLLEESVARHRARGNRASIGARGLGLALWRLGMVRREHGDLARALPLYEECLALHRALGDREGMAIALLGLGDIARDRGDMVRVRMYCEESQALFAELGDRWGQGISLTNLALAAYGQGDLERAGTLAERGLALLRELGSEPSIAETLLTVGRIAAAHGDAGHAAAALVESLTLLRARGPRYLVPSALEALAAVASDQRQPRVAARLLGAAAGLRDAIGASVPLVFQAAQEQALAAVRAALGDAAYEGMWTAGQTIPFEWVIAEALTLTHPLGGHGDEE